MKISRNCAQQVCKDGYEIVVTEAGGRRVQPVSGDLEPYNVLEEPLLFMTFAHKELHDRGVKEFADRFGTLGWGREGDDLADWAKLQQYLKQMIAIAEDGGQKFPPILEALGKDDLFLSLTPPGGGLKSEITLQIINLSAALRVQLAHWIASPYPNIIQCRGCERFVPVGEGTGRQITAQSCGERSCVNHISYLKRKGAIL